jgi:hypothetical protein
MRTLALVLLLAACGSSSSGPAYDTTLSSHASEPLARDTPAPKITWSDNGFVTPMLPAVARAAEITVVAVRDRDGERGFPNLAIQVRDRNDKTLQSITVLVPNEYEALAPGGTPGDVLQKRIDAANLELAKLHGLHDLVAMKPLDLQQPPDGSDQHLAIGDNLDVDWNKDHLHVFPHNVDRAVTTVDGHGWLSQSHTSCAGCSVCENPAFLGAVYHAPSINVIVAEIRYHGTDSCEEPGDQPHVIAWY